MSELGLIWRALMRNKVGAFLIAAQIATTMTIIVNAVHMIGERDSMMARPSGVDEMNSFHLTSTGYAGDFNEQQVVEQDLRNIRSMPGIVDATQINAIPMSGGGWSMGLKTEPGDDVDGTGVAVYMVDDHAIDALDVNIIAGRNFYPDEIRWRERAQTDWPEHTIITKAMAETLYPDSDFREAVGKTVFINNDEPMKILGIMDQLQAPWNGWDGVERVMLSPERTLFMSSRLFIRTEPGMRDEMMLKIEELLTANDDGRIIRDTRTMEEVRERSYRSDKALKTILYIVVVVLTLVTALGIVGLTSFSVNRRRKQIGVRRALGASRNDIMSYFMIENLMISIVGVVLGGVGSVALNMYLVNAFSLPSLAWYFVPTAMLVLAIVGQIAVFGPARKAAFIEPATATRSA